MTLRVAIKYLAIAMLVECIVMMLKHPIIIAQPMIVGTFGIKTFDVVMDVYNIYFTIIQAIIYLAFCYHIHLLDIQYTDAFFGRFFRIEMALTILNLLLSLPFFGFNKAMHAYLAKAVIEVLFTVNCVYAGIGIFKYFRTQAMNKVRISYFIWAGRHMIYFGILAHDIWSLFTVGRLDDSNGMLILYWALLMPILFVSRLFLVKGCKELADALPSEIKAPDTDEDE